MPAITSLARIERFVNHHISTVLKPLDDLSRAEDLEGLAKGLAFQLVENLGVLFRRDVADDVKSLDQEARASIRRHGIRFGAYHIFMPALLKPAPAELITLLWALKNDGLDKPGYGDLIPVLAAGRTSVVTDPTFERTFYKLAGFRFLGKRAVRIDILERLADLIRPLLQWKPGSASRPDGAYDGRRFTATTAMLSILGATPDDMEEILKGLGYRADSRQGRRRSRVPGRTDGLDRRSNGDSRRRCGGRKGRPRRCRRIRRRSRSASRLPKRRLPQRRLAQPETAEVAPETAAPASEASDEPVEAKPVLLWRPGSRNDNQRTGGRPQGDRRGSSNRAPQGEARREGGEPRREGEGRREGRDDNRKGGGGRPDHRGPDHRAKGRDGKPQGGQRPDKGDRQDRPDRNDRGPKPQQAAKFEARPPRKEKPLDPDSPFAKLAALKEQMKK